MLQRSTPNQPVHSDRGRIDRRTQIFGTLVNVRVKLLLILLSIYLFRGEKMYFDVLQQAFIFQIQGLSDKIIPAEETNPLNVRFLTLHVAIQSNKEPFKSCYTNVLFLPYMQRAEFTAGI